MLARTVRISVVHKSHEHADKFSPLSAYARFVIARMCTYES